MAVTASQLIAKVSDQGADVTAQKMRAVGTSVDEAGGKIRSFAMGAAVMGAAALVGIGVASVKMAGDFQSEMTSLVTGAGESESNLRMVSSGILNMAPAVGTTTKQLADGMYLIESSGQHGAQALQTLKDAAMGAKVGSADLGTVANGVTTIMTDFASSNITSSQAVNTLVATVAAGKTHMGDLAASLSSILPTASAAGVSLTDVSAAMATMTGEGTPAADASTYLRQTIMSLVNPASKGASALAEIGLKAEDVSQGIKKSLPDTLKLITDHLKTKFPEGSAAYVAALADIAGGSKQMQGILELTGDHLNVFEGNVAGITDAVTKGGNSITGWSKVQGDFNFKLDQAREVVETLGIRIGTLLLPYVSQILDVITPSVQAFANWAISGHAVSDVMGFISSHSQIMIPLLSGVGAAIGGVLVYSFATLAISIGSATIAAITFLLPFIAIGAAVAGVTAILVNFYNSNAGFRDFINNIGNAIQDTANKIRDWISSGDALKDVMKALQPAIAYLGPKFKELADSFGHLKEVATPVLEGTGHAVRQFGQWMAQSGIVTTIVKDIFIGIVAAIGFLATGLTLVVKGISNVITFFTTGGSNAKWLWDIFVGIGTFLASVFAPLWQKLVSVFQTQVAPAFAQLMPAISQLFSAFQLLIPVFQIIGAIIGTVLVVALGVLVGVISGAISGIVGFVGGLAQVLGGIVQIISGIIQIVVGIVTFFIDLFTGKWGKLGADLGTIGQGIVTMFAGIWNAVAGIFVAAFGLILGLISGFISGFVGFFQYLYDELIGHSIIPDLVNGMLTFFGNAWSGITGIFGNIGQWFHDRWQSVVDGFNSVLSGLSGFASTIWDGVIGTVKYSFNLIIDMIDGVIDHINGISGTIGIHISSIPHLASGTDFFGGGLVLVGEHGPELAYMPRGTRVIPNNQLSQMSGGASSGGADRPIVLVVNGREFARGYMPYHVDAIRHNTSLRF